MNHIPLAYVLSNKTIQINKCITKAPKQMVNLHQLKEGPKRKNTISFK
jgi:hypothetical protein